MDQREARLSQHRFGQSGNAAHDVDADARRSAKRGQVIDHGGDGGRRVVQLPVEMNHPSASIAVTQRTCLAMSMPTLMRILPSKR